MASSLAAQLSKIAATSTNALNLKAQKAAHSKSLIFEPRVAASQSFDTLYTICHEGFQELCLLDGRFLEFQRNIFSEQSQSEDRTQMTAAENDELDKKLESFLSLVGSRLRLNPAVKAVEWLVRRFRIHEYNTAFLLTTFLPYHTLPIFVSLLSILPSNIPEEYKFLHPYVRSLTPPQRHTIVHTAANNTTFASNLNSYILRICNARQHYPALTAFWASTITEATSAMLEKSRSGRKGVQLQQEEDVILRLLPTLNEGLAMKKVPDLRIGCYMLLAVLASKGGLDDKLLTAMMEAVVLGWTTETTSPGIVCLSVLAQHRGAKQLTRRVTKELLKVENLSTSLIDLAKTRRVDKLANGLCLALLDRVDKTGQTDGLPIVEQIIEKQLLNDPQVTVIVKALLLLAHKIDDATDAGRDIRAKLASSLVFLTQISGHLQSVISQAFKATTIDMDELEMKLHTTIRPKELRAPSEDFEMQDSYSSVPEKVSNFSSLLETLPTSSTTEVSFLSHGPSDKYVDLVSVFLAAVSNAADLDSFDEHILLKRKSAMEVPLYFSFYVRTWCGPYPVLARAAALQMTTRQLSIMRQLNFDVQALVPYTIVGLSDSAIKVRQSAAELLLEIGKRYPVGDEAKKALRSLPRWAVDQLYGVGDKSRNIDWISGDVICQVFGEILLPSLEACILDKSLIHSILEKALNRASDDTPKKNEKGLSQKVRASFLSFLASHVINTPLYVVKTRLLESLNRVKRVGTTSRTKLLLAVLQQWASLGPAEVSQSYEVERLDTALMDDQAVTTVTPNDQEGLRFLMSIVQGEVAMDRPTLITAVFRRLRVMWPSLKGDLCLETASKILEISQAAPDTGSYNSVVVEESAELLRTVQLSTDILCAFLSRLPSTTKLVDTPPAVKRRRTSHGEVARAPLQDPKQLAGAISQVTFVLQLIDSSNPGSHPELLKGLFNTLAELQHFKAQVASELAYLQGLVLSSLLAIVQAYKRNSGLKFDRSAVRTDLLVDCVQKSSSPQVQNSSLLLIAALADAAPEVVLHSVMPIFTFMGSSVLRQNDDYTSHVISQTIREVIPPLISSLRKEKRNPVTGAAELLLSFVTAFEHIPPHRRRPLFTSLIQTLGPEDFLSPLLAMLVDKYGTSDNIMTFSMELSSSFSVEVQLQGAAQHLYLIADVLKPNPTFSSILLGANEDGFDSKRVILDELVSLSHLLSQKKLVTQTGKLLQQDDMDAARIRELYSTLVENLLMLADTLKEDNQLHSACGDVLGSLLGLLSTAEYVKSVESLLDRPNEALRRKILRALEVRIDQESLSDAVSRTAMLSFLPQLTAIIRDSQDVLYKHIAIACVDKISEKYGKKDLEAVEAAAKTIASDQCLGQLDDRLRVMALLCLASLVEILREGIVSILPVAIPKTLEYMEASVCIGSDGQQLHNAGYSFMSSLVQYLPYMVSGKYLDKLLQISNESAEADLDEEADESRLQCLKLAAKQIDAKNMFVALEVNWISASAGPEALSEYFEVLRIAVEKHPKSVITKHSAVLANILMKSFDLRRDWHTRGNIESPEESIPELETTIIGIAIKMIYKWNDSTFRPIFAKMVEWASSLSKNDKEGKILRLQTLYAFMAVFFDDLKSIVTSYATYILDNSADILNAVDVKNKESKELWARVLRTLAKCFEHDQDDFWQSPPHFEAIAPVLCNQFTYASSLKLVDDLIPTIVELAAAADSADHHKTLNTAILKHMRSENGNVRLAAVKCQQALTDKMGEEWLSLLPEMLPYISELQQDDDDVVERETQRWIMKIEEVLGESLDSMLQ
ncbi:hypothetical protein B7463_g586, partial [Scytalidium lignicola]